MKKSIIFVVALLLMLMSTKSALAMDKDTEFEVVDQKSEYVNGIEIRYLKEFKGERENIEQEALMRYKEILLNIEEKMHKKVNINDPQILSLVMNYAFMKTSDEEQSTDMLEFLKFLDIYENYQKNDKIRNLKNQYSKNNVQKN